MPWLLSKSSQSPSELALAFIWKCYGVRRIEQLCPRPNSLLSKSNSLEERRTSALGINLETNRKPDLGSDLGRNLAVVVN